MLPSFWCYRYRLNYDDERENREKNAKNVKTTAFWKEIRKRLKLWLNSSVFSHTSQISCPFSVRQPNSDTVLVIYFKSMWTELIEMSRINNTWNRTSTCEIIHISMAIMRMIFSYWNLYIGTICDKLILCSISFAKPNKKWKYARDRK